MRKFTLIEALRAIRPILGQESNDKGVENLVDTFSKLNEEDDRLLLFTALADAANNQTSWLVGMLTAGIGPPDLLERAAAEARDARERVLAGEGA